MLVPDTKHKFFEDDYSEDTFLLFDNMKFSKNQKKTHFSTHLFILIYIMLGFITILSIFVHTILSFDVFIEFLDDKLHKGLIILNLLFAISILPYQLINIYLQAYRSWKLFKKVH